MLSEHASPLFALRLTRSDFYTAGMNINVAMLSQLTLVLTIFYLLPILLVMFSKQVSASRKLGWVILTVFLSWIGYALMLLLGPLLEEKARDRA